MERVKPPEYMDWVDAVMGAVVIVAGLFLTAVMFDVLVLW